MGQDAATARFKGKAALVIGAGSAGPGWGNGKACAVQLAREGACVGCFDLNKDAAAETAAIIRAEGGESLALSGDATRSADLKAAVDETARAWGTVDVLINNVGIVVMGGVADISEEAWDRAFAVNVKGTFLAMKHAIPLMAAQGGGSIVNISSISSIRYLGTPYASYYSSKAALNHLTRVTASEYASRQVRVNAVLPGLMDTPMAKLSAKHNRGVSDDEIDEVWRQRAARIPMGWMGDAWDIAKASAFLASTDARFITGVTLVVDGGMTLAS
jgi:NAD(P)-dependent dehydrogenase (short-subunit alcohol dehydrogenase family)